MPAFRGYFSGGRTNRRPSLYSILNGLAIETQTQLPKRYPDIPAFARVSEIFAGILFDLLHNTGNDASFTLDVWLRWIQLTRLDQMRFNEGKQLLEGGFPRFKKPLFLNAYLHANLVKWYSERFP